MPRHCSNSEYGHFRAVLISPPLHLLFLFLQNIKGFQENNDIRDVGSTAHFADVSDFCCFSLILLVPLVTLVLP